MTEIMTAIILGIVEGLTEFLPVSSTGHLIIATHTLSLESEAPLTGRDGQPTVYLAFGAAVGLSAFARVLSIMSDHGGSWRNLLLLVVQTIIASLTLAYVFGLT